eukprot:CAMPEP_0178927662 /NCGR_PEP_ID=MMETSP0786-20121207/19346_1 /TAXON_ID=186022 /ORGANISM="Thalassionema frauenfeldii, Strain CCMP 1798" /LENGTH=334 /DNA_ID=CAMNT_0020603187 /DNA_START=87 /DNA_END=1088 /DNA_ORIENTATION=+
MPIFADNPAISLLMLPKLGIGFVAFLLAVLFGFFISSQLVLSAFSLSMATSFGGGVFLGTAMIHMLAEAAEVKGSIFDPYFLCCLGFLSILGVDVLLHQQQSDLKIGNNKSDVELEIVPLCIREDSANDFSTDVDDLDGSVDKQMGKSSLALNNWPDSSSNADSVFREERSNTQRSTSSLVLVAGLSFHSIFDGLAIGSTTSIAKLRAVTIAVMSHKPIAAFALGSALLSQRQKCGESSGSILQSILIFAITCPVGIILGIAILRFFAAGDKDIEETDVGVVEALCQSFAAGTFLYVASVEVLAKEFRIGQQKGWKFAFCFIGFLLMASLKLLE